MSYSAKKYKQHTYAYSQKKFPTLAVSEAFHCWGLVRYKLAAICKQESHGTAKILVCCEYEYISDIPLEKSLLCAWR